MTSITTTRTASEIPTCVHDRNGWRGVMFAVIVTMIASTALLPTAGCAVLAGAAAGGAAGYVAGHEAADDD